MATTRAYDIAEEKEQVTLTLEALRLKRHKIMVAARFLSEVTVRPLIESLGEGFLVIDQDQRIILTNRRLEQMLGFDTAELVGQPLDRLLPDRWIEIHRHHVEAYLDDPHIRPMGQDLELTARRKDGSELAVEVSLSWLDMAAGRFAVALVMDVTQRKQAELSLLEQNEALNTFAETVAHDLQSSVTVMMGLSEFLAEAHTKMSEVELHQQLLHINESSQKMSSIIHEILLLASLRKDEVDLRPLDMSSILEAVVSRLEPAILERHAQVVLPETFPLALGYGPWVEEVWLNYLSNAIRYGGCEDEGRSPQVEIGSTVKGDGDVKFWAKDNGPGIAAERLPHIFAAGQRLDQTRVQGHGLGLSIVQRIVRKLDGHIGVESDLGQGSVFSFSLRQAK